MTAHLGGNRVKEVAGRLGRESRGGVGRLRNLRRLGVRRTGENLMGCSTVFLACILAPLSAPASSQTALAAGRASVSEPLMLCAEPFVPDGFIGEFVNFHGDAQEYFVVDPFQPRYGQIREGAYVCRQVIVVVDDDPSPGRPYAAGPTGFEDHPSYIGARSVPTGFNIGRVFMALDPTLDPDGDESNGQGVYFVAVDVSAPRMLDLVWNTQPVAFDSDGNGDSGSPPSELYGECGSEAPGFFDDVYLFEIDANEDGCADLEIGVGERRGSTPPDAIPIDVPNSGQVAALGVQDVVVRRYLRFRVTSGTGFEALGGPREQALLFLDSNQDGLVDWQDIGVGADIEFAIVNVSGLPEATTPFHAGLRVSAVSFDNVPLGSAMDSVAARLHFPCIDGQTCGSDGNVCTYDECTESGCAGRSIAFGNADGGGPVDIDDLMCVLRGVARFEECPSGDLAPACTGDGVIDLEDVLAVIQAFGGDDPCHCE